jgi:predicted acetyltransferase
MSKNNFRAELLEPHAELLLQNLLELYLHDMAEWFGFDISDDGTYGYDLSSLWEKGDSAYLVLVDEKPAGFALVALAEEHQVGADVLEIVEFFLLRQHRHKGVGDYFARWLWDQQPEGQWLVRVYEANLPAVPFWRRTISAYTNNAYEEERRLVDDRPWRYFTFDNSTFN